MNDDAVPATPDQRPAAAVGRRTVLKTAGAAAALGAVLPGRALAATDRTGIRSTADVIVVGAGYAGATATRELRASGVNTLVLEARDRIGGCIWTDTFAGYSIELGGQWLTWGQPHVAAELRRYGIDLYPDEFLEVEKAYFPSPRGQQQVDFLTAITRQGELLAKVMEGSQEYFPRPYEPLYRADLLAAVDRLSLRDRMNQLNLSEQDHLWLSSVTAGYSGGSSATGGLAGMAQWWALGGHTNAGWDGLTQQRPVGGMTAVAQRMLAESGAEVRLRTVVTQIADDGSGVTVVTRDGSRYRAKAVVVALPVNVWKTITFSPGLPRVHAAATAEGVGVPNSAKLWLRLGGEIGAAYACGAEGAPITNVIPKNRLPNGDVLALAFSEWSGLRLDNPSAVQAAVQAVLPGARVLEYRAQSWSRDPFSRGGWGLRRPNQYLSHLPAIQQPHGRVFFAAADIANGWYGAFIDGAIESGFRVHRQVISRL